MAILTSRHELLLVVSLRATTYEQHITLRASTVFFVSHIWYAYCFNASLEATVSFDSSKYCDIGTSLEALKPAVSTTLHTPCEEITDPLFLSFACTKKFRLLHFLVGGVEH